MICLSSKALILISNGKESFYGCDNLIIYGVKNSYAETYAKENNIEFELMY